MLKQIGTMTALSVSLIAVADANYCHQPDKIAQWEQILERNPNDPIVIQLYALRTGLCQMIDAGQVGVDEAIVIFEREHQRLINDRRFEDSRKTPEHGA